MGKKTFIKGFCLVLFISVMFVGLVSDAQAVAKWRYQSMFPPSIDRKSVV